MEKMALGGEHQKGGGRKGKKKQEGDWGFSPPLFSLFVPAKSAIRKVAQIEKPSILGNTLSNECALVNFCSSI